MSAAVDSGFIASSPFVPEHAVSQGCHPLNSSVDACSGSNGMRPHPSVPLPAPTNTALRRRSLDELSWYFACGSAALGFSGVDPSCEVHAGGGNSVEATLVGMVEGDDNDIRKNRRIYNVLGCCSYSSQRTLELCFTVPAARIELLQHLMMGKRVYKRPVSAETASKRALARWNQMRRHGYNLQPLVPLDCVVDGGRFVSALEQADEMFEVALAEYQRSLAARDR